MFDGVVVAERVGLAAGACLGLLPGGVAGAAVVALLGVFGDEAGDALGQVFGGCARGVGVHGGGAVVVGEQQCVEGVFGAGAAGAFEDVDFVGSGGGGVFVVEFSAESFVEVGLVGVAAACHGDVGQGAGGFDAHQGVAGVCGDALG